MKNKMKNKVTPKNPKFNKFLKGFTLAALVLIASFMVFLWFFLTDYQKMLPGEYGNQIVQAYQTGDVKTLGKYSDNMPASFQNPTIFNKYLEQFGDSKTIFFYPITSKNPNQILYEIASDTKVIASLTLEKTGKKSIFGFNKYKIVNLSYHPLYEYTITAPSDVSIVINDLPIDTKYLTDEKQVIASFAQVQTDPITYVKYKISDFNYIVTLTAQDASKSELVIEKDDAKYTYTISKVPSEAIKTEITAFATKVSKAYSVYTTLRYSPFRNLSVLLYPNTAFFNYIHTYGNEWNYTYTVDRYENLEIKNFIKYSETEYSCDISYKYVILRSTGVEKSFPVSWRYYVTKKTGTWLVADMRPQ